MQAALGGALPCAAPAALHCYRGRVYSPPCAPSTSSNSCSPSLGSRLGRRRGGLVVRASSKDNRDDKIKHEQQKADFSAKWAMRVKNFFSGRRKYLQEAESGGDQAAEEAYEAELAEKQKKLQEMRLEIMEEREAELLAKQAEAQGPQESLVAGDIYRARMDLVKNPLSRAALAVVRVQSLLRAVVMLPFAMAGWLFRSWQAMFATQRYENFLMAEGERIWYWRNRTENERWFWEIFVWDRLIFPILAVACYEYLVPNHLLWAVVAPLALLTWLTGKLISPITPEFWLVAYLGFYRKCWPDVAAWLSNVLLAW